MKYFILGYLIGGVLCSYVVLDIVKRGVYNVWMYGIYASTIN